MKIDKFSEATIIITVKITIIQQNNEEEELDFPTEKIRLQVKKT